MIEAALNHSGDSVGSLTREWRRSDPERTGPRSPPPSCRPQGTPAAAAGQTDDSIHILLHITTIPSYRFHPPLFPLRNYFFLFYFSFYLVGFVARIIAGGQGSQPFEPGRSAAGLAGRHRRGIHNELGAVAHAQRAKVRFCRTAQRLSGRKLE